MPEKEVIKAVKGIEEVLGDYEVGVQNPQAIAKIDSIIGISEQTETYFLSLADEKWPID